MTAGKAAVRRRSWPGCGSIRRLRALWGQPRARATRACAADAARLRSMRRLISAPTIAGCSSPSRRGAAFSSSMPSPASSALAKACSARAGLSDAAMNRTVEALKICADKMRRRGVSRSRVIATEACRIAANGDEFIERVRRDTGLAIEIVSRETEAKLAVSGCASLIDRNSDMTLIFDIGGGSSELIWLDLTPPRPPVAPLHRRSARGAKLHRRLDLAAAWRRQPRRTPWRPRRHAAKATRPWWPR